MKKILKPFLILGTALTLFQSCSFFIEQSEKGKQVTIIDSPKLHFVFSHNVSGETHPCGCRNFPLGGLPQVYGLFENLKKTGEVFYVDTGDTFFPSSVIPKTMHTSLGFAAENLAKGLDLLGVRYIVPGDQDFAMGWNFLQKIDNDNKFSFFVSNYREDFKKKQKIESEDYSVIQRGPSRVYLLSLVHPEAVPQLGLENLLAPEEAMPKLLSKIKRAGYDEKNPYHRLIVLSHAGIDNDQELARKNPMIDWIIGAHSQSFLRFSTDIGKTKIVQTLSKNHYIGDITIDLSLKNTDDTYTLHEIRDELKDQVSPNPFNAFIDQHKTKMNELQVQEQSHLSFNGADQLEVKKFSSASSCLECHKPQVEFWQGTAHSIAYLTLIKAKEENNLTCIECHSVGLNSPHGFNTAKGMFLKADKTPVDSESYHAKLNSYTKGFNSVRGLQPIKIKKIAKDWAQFDKDQKVKHNFSNVQCLNCHNALAIEHPFSADAPLEATKKNEQMKNQCLSCHTVDQSPEWYKDSTKKLVNDSVYNQKLKKVSCPLGTN